MDMPEAHAILEPLTQQEHSCLMVADDWKAPYEVAAILYPRGATIPQRKRVAVALRSLHSKGLLDFGASQNTYRRSDAGNLRASVETTCS